jgi:hypothetical protein
MKEGPRWELQDQLLYSQKSAVGPHAEPDESSLHQ